MANKILPLSRLPNSLTIKHRHNILLPTMEYRIKLAQSEEGWAVSCPALPGCHSQGTTREEAIQNIKVAIREWLEVEAEENGLLKVLN